VRGSAQAFLRPIRRLGQNFLIDRRVVEKLLALAAVSRDDVVLEVGPGLGNITALLAERASKVIAVEKDRRLASYLRQKYADQNRVHILEGDFLKVDLPEFDKVVGTPPYYISSRLVLSLLKSRFTDATLVLQREFAERLAAEPGGHNYGRLTVMFQHSARIDLLDLVPPSAFRPSPKVESRIVKIIPKGTPCREDHRLLEELVRELFNQRRRKLSGPLRRYLRKVFEGDIERILAQVPAPEKRVYELTPKDFEEMTRALGRMIADQPGRAIDE